MWIKENYKSILITTILLLIFYGFALQIVLFTPEVIHKYIFSEQGPYESLSPLLWLLLAIFSLCHSYFRISTRLVMASAAVLFALREWDLHKALFGTSFIKSRYYFNPEIPVMHKIGGALILAFILYLAIYLLVQYFKALKVQIKEPSRAFRYMNLALVLLVISKVLDRMSSQMVELFHVRLSAQTELIIWVLEESTEMLLPTMFLVAIILHSYKYKSKVNTR